MPGIRGVISGNYNKLLESFLEEVKEHDVGRDAFKRKHGLGESAFYSFMTAASLEYPIYEYAVKGGRVYYGML